VLPGRNRATAHDAAETYALLEECSNFLGAKGVAQWDPSYPRRRFDRDVSRGEVWLWRSADGVDATITLSTLRPDYYPERIWRDTIRAWYLCRFAVARRLSGMQLGVRLLAELEGDARAAGIEALRLDVTATNPFLAGYYAERGFEVAGRDEIKGDASIFLQKPLVVHGVEPR
jgi:ribosomal protein S18 acetylase RimI-like enzyme